MPLGLEYVDRQGPIYVLVVRGRGKLTRVQPDQASRTAQYMALFRALETARPAAEWLFSDPLAAPFLGGPLRVAAALAAVPGLGRLVPTLIDRRWPGPRASAVVRTRVIDDALLSALERGLDQLVLLGAGYDSRPYRLPGVRDLQVFEVDHPTTQAVKSRALRQILGELPAHVRFVPIDFDREALGATMATSGLARGQRTFTIWEGVLPAYLAERGWRPLDDLSTTEALARYGLDVVRVPSFYRIARARVATGA